MTVDPARVVIEILVHMEKCRDRAVGDDRLLDRRDVIGGQVTPAADLDSTVLPVRRGRVQRVHPRYSVMGIRPAGLIWHTIVHQEVGIILRVTTPVEVPAAPEIEMSLGEVAAEGIADRFLDHGFDSRNQRKGLTTMVRPLRANRCREVNTVDVPPGEIGGQTGGFWLRSLRGGDCGHTRGRRKTHEEYRQKKH